MFVTPERKKHFTRISMSYTEKAHDKATERVTDPVVKEFTDRYGGTLTKPHPSGGMC
jgi:hypothetical protein